MCNFNSNKYSPTGIDLNLNLMSDNNYLAGLNRDQFDAAGVRCLNLMSSPGTGKTTLLERTLAAIQGRFQAAVIEGDMSTELDAERLRAYGVPVAAVTTGRACHLDVQMVAKGVKQFDLNRLDLIFIENVGNLICPAEYPLGEHSNVILVGVTEGEDKPLKYPVMFYEADCVVITKTDLSPFLKVNLDQLVSNIHQVRPGIPVFSLSAETGQGLPAWTAWIEAQVALSQEKSKATVRSFYF